MNDPKELAVTAWELRRNVLQIVAAGKGGHIGGDMSVIDILTALYFREMNISPENRTDPERDRFVLSKGHSVEAYYAVLAARGFFPLQQVLEQFSRFNTPFIGHPNNKLPGIEMNSGSLGHGLPVCVGMALAGKMDGRSYRTYTVMGLISSAKETETLAAAANPNDETYLVPAFTGLGAPYWDESARAAAVGMSRTTGKAEFVRAALDCIAYQITDLVLAMEQDAEMTIDELRVDGGPTRNRCLMQFQSDISGKRVVVPEAEELSGIGAAYLAGISAGLWKAEELFAGHVSENYVPQMDLQTRRRRYEGWLRAVESVLNRNRQMR